MSELISKQHYYPIQGWPGYSVTLDGEVFSPKGISLSCDSRGRVILRGHDQRTNRISVATCLRMAGLVQQPGQELDDYDVLVKKCSQLEGELLESRRKISEQSRHMQDIKALEDERDELAAALKKARAEVSAAKANRAKEKKAMNKASLTQPTPREEELERRLRLARKLNGHLIAAVQKRGGFGLAERSALEDTPYGV